tara:strand:+ start:78 stop:446 length:369 start_codon:yes stop_codon:yes gene_type:complete
MVVEGEDLLKLVEMVMNRVAPVVVEAVLVVEGEDLDHQSLVRVHLISLVDIMVAVDNLDLVLMVVTKVAVAVALLKMVLMLTVLEHLELRVVVQVVMEKKFHQHTYQTLLHQQLLDQTLVNS